MIGLFGALQSGLLKASEVSIDNNVCKLHYRVTVVFLLAFCILVTSRQYIGDPIECMTSADIPGKVLDQYCWITSTFTLPKALGKKVGSEVPHHGIGQYKEGDERIFHQYYQWVCFVLFLQAIMFYTPHYLWKIWEGGRLKDLVIGLKSPIATDDEREKRQGLLVRYFTTNFHNHNMYFSRFFLCELLNLINVVGQIYFTNKFLGGEFTTYGTEVLRFTETGQEDRTDPMIRVFPRITKCTFHSFGRSGDVQKHDALCILPINIINEKIYVFLWFWFIILAAITGLEIGYRLLQMAFPHVRFFLLKMLAKVPSSRIETIAHKAQIGDWFLLCQMGKNMYWSSFVGFLHALEQEIDGKKTIPMKDMRNDKSNNHNEYDQV